MMKVQANCSSRMTDEEMQAVRGMGIRYLAVNFLPDAVDYDSVMRFAERAAAYDLYRRGRAGRCGEVGIRHIDEIVRLRGVRHHLIE